ncbi:MAG: HD domain-containing protein [Clostridia bacterium]|nr:HD domain-containing protein [Clostridia bacterium]
MISKEFYIIIKDIIHSDEYRGMKNYRHHVKGNVYDHSIKVACMCYNHHKRFGTKIDLTEFIRGALLHDYYLYDWHDKTSDHRFHGFTHPGRALENAYRKYPDLTLTQRDMILHHMFPLTPVPPRTKAGWLICFYDKVAAVSDYCGKNKWKAQNLCAAKKFSAPGGSIRKFLKRVKC